jgi:hypothetical protein
MRHAVKKPAKLTPQKASAAAASLNPQARLSPVLTVSNSPILLKQDIAREKRSQKIQQSELVRKFSDHHTPGLQPVTKSIQPLAVEPAPALTHHLAPISSAEKLIERGLRAAQSHTGSSHHHKSAPKKRKLSSIGAASFAVLLLGTFFAYQSIPNVSVRYASAKAGLSAQLPSYQPAGFAIDRRIQYTPGQVTIRFSSNADSRAYSLTQRASTWNSDTLVNNYVSNKSENYQTIEDKGRIIYLYDEANATWVNGGVWYEIEGNSQLNRDQLIRIATSI